MEEADLVVIGAGWHGLITAKTYLECNPSTKLVVLDAGSSIGGVWAKEHLYPGLKSNNMLGTFEYSDFPMDEATFGVKPGQHIPGHVVHDYLHKYADKFGLYQRIRFESKVETLERQESGGWVVGFIQGGSRKLLLADKVIVATGLTSEPLLPNFPGQETFEAPFFHCRDLLKHSNSLLTTATSVAIFGGTKSAWDAAHAFAAAGISVDWIIRESGHGPIWMAPPYVTPFKIWLEKLVHTRFLTWFSPCIWGDSDGFLGIRSFFHRTRLGRGIVDSFWKILASDVTGANQYDKHPETKKLKPWVDAFWVASSLSILNYPTDFFDYVRNGKIQVHIADITKLSKNAVHLSSEEVLRPDALICSTGWKHRPSINFLPEGIDEQLGLPHALKGPEDKLIQQADDRILHLFPRLKLQPMMNQHYKPLIGTEMSPPLEEPYRLYRFMVPPAFIDERSIAYNGFVQSITTSLIAQAQALWLTAYLDGSLQLTPVPEDVSVEERASRQKQIEWETILQTQFCKWRHPAGFGKRYPDFVFDALPYIDMLLKDLGLRNHRKETLLNECFQAYGPEDYKGLVDEWRIKVRASCI
ncbi:hypothetical protein V1504DRAFT_396116 [Lipomyces starkeyi]